MVLALGARYGNGGARRYYRNPRQPGRYHDHGNANHDGDVNESQFLGATTQSTVTTTSFAGQFAHITAQDVRAHPFKYAFAAAEVGMTLTPLPEAYAAQPVVVIVAGCVLAGLTIAGDRGLVNINKPVWIALMLIAAICYALWERIEKLWR